MNKLKPYFKLLSLMIAALLNQACDTTNGEKKSTSNSRPNIIFIMSDDHAYQAISAYDNKLIETPNIDRIAQMGMLFTNASVTNSICAPSRATILTGKHTHLNGKVDNHFAFDDSNITFPQILQENGYQTAMFGKLHFGNNPKGFDQFKILPGQGAYWNPDFITKNEGEIRVDGYATDIITDFTLDWLQEERDPAKPFLLMYLHKAPHRSWYMANRHYDEFLNRTFPEPSTLFDDYSGMGNASKEAEMSILHHMGWSGDNKVFPEVMDEMGLSEIGYDKFRTDMMMNRMTETQKAEFKEAYAPIFEDFKKKYPSMDSKDLMRWKYQRYMQDYLGTIKAVDENVGRVLDYLEENNLMENTIIVYTSDQGFYLGEHGWFDKRFAYNESFKTPLLVSWKDHIRAGSRSDEMVQNLDFAQTFLDAAGIEAPKEMQGESLRPLLEETGKWDRDAVYYHYYEYPAEHMVNRHYAIVTKEYKLIHYYFSLDEWELIDRLKDPEELTNVYDDPAYAEVRKELHKKLEELRVQYKDSDQLSDEYIDKFLADAVEGKVYGLTKERAKAIQSKRAAEKAALKN
ncbi:MAG: sulfatase [Flavobacteriaceae bacterium]|nr:sulfatase [Flavobacteriaceae bacterium]